jgi:hypothetical protein
MNDVKDLLAQALDQLPQAGATADPASDLARGRNLLRRRRGLRAAGITAACAAVAIAVVPAVTHGPAPHPSAASPAIATVKGVRLVAYTGTQPPGYTVKEIPDGWVIQGSTSYLLTIAPANDPDKSPDSFLGKLVVSWESVGATSANGQPVTVAGRPGYYSEQNADGVLTQTLIWKDTKGRWISVESAASLGWNETALAKFAAGVTVTSTAKPSLG